jgi:crotonobetainyl-CoA:carnitine CoA-transferase CaiB-like acyl-CoA transferase
LPDSAPNNLYVAQDGHYVHITAMGDSVFMRLAQAMNRPDLALDPLYQTGQARSANEEDLDRIIGQWAVGYTARELERMLEDNGVPAARIYDMADVFKDEHFLEREMLVKVQDPVLGELTVPGIVPKLSRTPGRVVHAGRDIGQNTHEVLERLLGMDVESISKLEASRAIFCGALKTPKSQMEAQP